jgi:hypothetical protein
LARQALLVDSAADSATDSAAVLEDFQENSEHLALEHLASALVSRFSGK